MSETQNHDPFIPSSLDESGLQAAPFRVLCHLWRRGKTFSNAATIASICRMKRNTVFQSLSDLEKAGFIRRTPRPGQTTLIEPVPFGDTGGNDDPSRLGIRGVTRLGIQDPSRLGIHKGTPTKAIPLRQSKEAAFPELPFSSDQFKEAWSNWRQHRKEKKIPITPTSTKMQFKKLSVMGEARAIAAINHSTAEGYQGIYEPSGQPSKATVPTIDHSKNPRSQLKLTTHIE